MDKNGCCAATDDDQMAQLIEKARQQADPAARRDAWHQAAMYQYTKDLSILPIAELVGLMLISSRIDYQPTGQTEDMQLKLGDIRFK
jgi:ABC-type oligopeptide transport system substrate-binding subunit